MRSVIQWLLLGTLMFPTDLVQAEVHGALNLGVGRKLSPEEPETTFSAEPEFSYTWLSGMRARTSSLVERPTDPYKEFRVPRLVLAADFLGAKGWVFTSSLNALELERWSADGSMIRLGANVERRQPVGNAVVVSLRGGPYLQVNRFAQRADGRDLPGYGLAERLKLEAEIGIIVVDLRFFLEQRFQRVWKNDFGTLERVGVRLTPWLSTSVQHELLSSIVDDSTGTSRGVRLFDNRESKVS